MLMMKRNGTLIMKRLLGAVVGKYIDRVLHESFESSSVALAKSITKLRFDTDTTARAIERSLAPSDYSTYGSTFVPTIRPTHTPSAQPSPTPTT